ncbi:MAG: MSMEG_0567/sll0787 family protein, partial [Solirubrobacteraceae bacterium]|nr:AIR synthase related protein [Patulibacter sp.]
MFREDRTNPAAPVAATAEFILDGDRPATRPAVRARRAPSRAAVVPRRRTPISTAPPSLTPALVPPPELRLLEATGDAALMAGYRALRREAFVQEQGLFDGHDLDAHDEDPRTRVLVVIEREGRVVGGVRVHPAQLTGRDIGWWRGSRLVAKPHRDLRAGSIGSALVQGACRVATEEGVLRFDAHVQEHCEPFFTRLGWERTGAMTVAGMAHVAMRWPVGRFADLAGRTKSPIGRLTADLLPSDGPMAAWLGDDGMPLPGADGLVACVDAILPAMVERDPEWAGWCGMLVTAHDLSAMGAAPFAALDTIGAKDEATLARVIAGLKAGSEMFELPIVGGHTQLGTAGHLTVTGLGRTNSPIPAGGGRPGDTLQLTADLAGGWRPGYEGRQWDSSTTRTREEMREMLEAVGAAQPHAAKDVSMAGIVGTTGMLAEASGCGAELVVGQIPRPTGATLAEWLTCFPGFAMVTATAPEAAPMPAGAARSAACGALTEQPGVRLVWPDGEVTTAIGGPVTGLGATRFPTAT